VTALPRGAETRSYSTPTGYPAPGGHAALNDRPEEEGDIAMRGAEDLTNHDEPERASGMRGADDTPSTAPRKYEGRNCTH
jgi:hypothetical protein